MEFGLIGYSILFSSQRSFIFYTIGFRNSMNEIYFERAYKDYPYKLLHLADPSPELVNSYLKNGICYIVKIRNVVVGTFVVLEISLGNFEIMNISVDPNYQNKGIGRQILYFAIGEAKKRNAKNLFIATGNSSLHQLSLYQSIGFIVDSIERDFFIKNYDNPIFENGMQCRDKIILKLDLNIKKHSQIIG